MLVLVIPARKSASAAAPAQRIELRSPITIQHAYAEKVAFATAEASEANRAAAEREKERRGNTAGTTLRVETRDRLASMKMPTEKRELTKAFNKKVVKRNKMASRWRAAYKKAEESKEKEEPTEEMAKGMLELVQQLDRELDREERFLKKGRM